MKEEKKTNSNKSSETVFKSVKIGNQEWMSDNLNVDHFRNGDIIPEVKSKDDWKEAGKNGQPAWCYYENDPKNGEKYGKFYNWYAVNDPRGLAPEGWHVPSDGEWTEMINFLDADNNPEPQNELCQPGQSAEQSKIVGGMLKYTGSDGDDTYIYHPDRASADINNVREGLWNSPNTGATNETGFSALPGGERSKSGKDKYISFVTSFWSSTELKEEEKTNIESWYKDDPIAWYWKIGYSRAAISRGILNQGHGVNVRCVKD